MLTGDPVKLQRALVIIGLILATFLGKDAVMRILDVIQATAVNLTPQV